jgi:hypothetical protein
MLTTRPVRPVGWQRGLRDPVALQRVDEGRYTFGHPMDVGRG